MGGDEERISLTKALVDQDKLFSWKCAYGSEGDDILKSIGLCAARVSKRDIGLAERSRVSIGSRDGGFGEEMASSMVHECVFGMAARSRWFWFLILR